MKKINKIKHHLVLACALVLGLVSCKKGETDENGQLEAGKGAPTITSVRTVSKSTVDSSRVDTYTTYNGNGTVTTTTAANYTPQITAFDSTTVTGKLGNYYAIMGSNLGSATQIQVNNVSVPFNRALSSDNTLIFNIPSTTPFVQPLPNTLTVVTLNGSATYAFTVLAPPPTVSNFSDFNFVEGSQIKMSGRGFSALTAVNINGTTTPVTIVSKADTQLVVRMPATTQPRVRLSFTYTAGTETFKTGPAQEFVNITNNYPVFAMNEFKNGWVDASWEAPSGVTTDASRAGTSSLKATYPSNGWKVEGWANWNDGITYNADYKFLTFWVKGGLVDHVLTLVGDQMEGGYGQNTSPSAFTITVPAKVWTYFKIPLAPRTATNTTALNFWKNGTVAKQLGFFLKGESSHPNETLFFDQVVFVK